MMKLKFDSSQQFQLDAVASIVDLFDGQPLRKGDFSVEIGGEPASLFQNELGFGNNLMVTRETIFENLQKIQERNDLDLTERTEFEKNGLNFTIEMETGTGKTYVYLRTIFELNAKYGFKKFVIVVPSVAIREGTLKNIEITRDHFRALYNNVEFEYFVYDGKKANKLRSFATANQIQVMIINIDAFRKDFSASKDDKKSNVIYKINDKLSGRKPIDFVQSTNPFVIIDEPQSVDNTDKAQEAINSLNPLCILRYSATHKNLYNQVYKLDPVRAFELRLVKQIIVAEVSAAASGNTAYLKLLEVNNKKGLTAKVRLHVQMKESVQEKDIWVKNGTDLFVTSNEREAYRNGYQISEISAIPGNEYIELGIGILRQGEEVGGMKEEIAEVQIRNTIKRHLDKELEVRERGIKVLSLFFIDRVHNYRSYDEQGNSLKGKFAKIFEQHYEELLQLDKYKALATNNLEDVHNGYFSQDKKGKLKDTNGATADDTSTYDLIMKDKEKLLSIDNPLRFIFSHSALREGWDNPNVFQICTLNETKSTIKKRQEIGRGLRLPVDQSGNRVFDNNINHLVVFANESYETFASSLQKEYEDDCGVTFGTVSKYAFARIVEIGEDEEVALGRKRSEVIWEKLVENGILDAKGKITSKFTPTDPNFDLGLEAHDQSLASEIILVIDSYRLERHLKKDEQPERIRVKSNKELSEQDLDVEFRELWDRIKHKTTYRVEYESDYLIRKCSDAIGAMDRVEKVEITYMEAGLDIGKKGVQADLIRSNIHRFDYKGPLPDLVSYIQRETELTRRTIVQILTRSGRLGDFLNNPQKFMDSVARIINLQLNKLIVDGIKYEKVAGEYYDMKLFEEKELLAYLSNRLKVRKSVYDYIVYDSNTELQFAQTLDRDEDVKLFLKLPNWFKVKTPIGEYNPDWAIVKLDESKVYLVRETKGLKNELSYRGAETLKIKCGKKHFSALGVDYAVITDPARVI